MKRLLLLSCVFSLGINGYIVAESRQEKRDMLLERLNAATDATQEQDELSASAEDNLRCPCTKPRPRSLDAEGIETTEDDVLDIEDVEGTEPTRNEQIESVDTIQDIEEVDGVEYTINEAGERCPCSRPKPRPRAQ